MKLSTRARYGLRMMVELAKELKKNQIVQLGRIAAITGLSENYLAQLAMPLRKKELLVGVSGKKGGYYLGRPAEKIKVREIVETVGGPLHLTDCVDDPSVCLNSSFCESRMIWVILSDAMIKSLDSFYLSDLIDKNRIEKIINKHNIELLNPDKVMAELSDDSSGGCPVMQGEK